MIPDGSLGCKLRHPRTQEVLVKPLGDSLLVVRRTQRQNSSLVENMVLAHWGHVPHELMLHAPQKVVFRPVMDLFLAFSFDRNL